MKSAASAEAIDRASYFLGKRIWAMAKIKTRSVKWYGWKPDTPDFRDHMFAVAPHDAMPRHHQLPANLMPAIRDQGEQGSCTGHGAYGVATYLHHWSGQKTSDRLSPRFAYWNARVIEGTTMEDSGAEIRDVVKGVVKFGISTETLCKYNPRRYTQRPGAAAFKNALTETITSYQRIRNGDINAVKAALATDIPVIFGFACYANIDSPDLARSGLLTMPTGEMDGGHCVWACGFDDDLVIGSERGAILCANSWGASWGCKPEGYASRGYFWMPYAYAGHADLADDFWACTKIS
jgi:C1A family cysteine protease